VVFGFRAGLLKFACALLALVPTPVGNSLGSALGWLLWQLPTRASKVTSRNLKLIEPRLRLDALETLRAYGRGVLDTLRIWGSPAQKLLTQIEAIENEKLLFDALQAGRGVLIAAPHLGAFELLNLYLAARGSLHILYKAPKQAWLEPLLCEQRARLGANPVAASASGVRTLLKALKRGEMVGILPDQQPKLGEGEFADFFGIPALTMTLFCKLSASSGASVLMAFAERTKAGYRLHFNALDERISDTNTARSVAYLNAEIEALVRLAPEQYQWTYKRYSMRPPGADSVYK